jgi:hypothetical protein
LIYFIFIVDTYVISFVFTCLSIIGGVAAGVRILLEKGPSRDHILKIRKIPEKSQKLYFPGILTEPEGGVERSQGGPTLAAPALCVGALAHF